MLIKYKQKAFVIGTLIIIIINCNHTLKYMIIKIALNPIKID